MGNRFFPNYDSYIITSPFGMRTLKGKTRMHSGIDLVATKNGTVGRTDSIMAHTGGVVCGVGYDESAGNFVKIQVDPDTVMVYYHMKKKCSLKKGAAVKTGDILGYMGSTGNSTGAHLHFGIRHKGEWIDPAPYLDADWKAPGVKTVNIAVPVLKRGCKGESVKALQILLTGWGYACDADGSFGPATENALRACQEKRGWTVDGKAGPQVWRGLLGMEGA